MRTFEFFIDDERYSVPTLVILSLAGVLQARERAEKLLAESPHHRGIEICEDGARLYVFGSYAAARQNMEDNS